MPFSLPKRRKFQLIKSILLIITIVLIYNIVNFTLTYTRKDDLTDLFIPRPKIIKYIDVNDYKKRSLKAPNLRIKTNIRHEHVQGGINNSLLMCQAKFLLPKGNDGLLGGTIPFAIFPFQTPIKSDDRIWNQMRYIPEHIARSKIPPLTKIILLYNGLSGMNDDVFNTCPVKSCRITDNRELATSAHVVLWMHNIGTIFHKRPPNQVWAFYFLESPYHTPSISGYTSNFGINWTATYRHDSTIVTPYFKYTPFDLTNPEPEMYELPIKNYASGKTKMAAWFVSNCGSRNNRLDFAKRLKKYVQVDIYGGCGELSCPRHNSEKCFEMLNKNYRFYLAFENSNCRDYITEKLFLNGLSHDVIPIVMGAHPDDYKRVAPPHSYIHIEDFPTVKKLADYMIYLSNNMTAYNEYFSWKHKGLIDTNTFFWCRLCMMAHEADRTKSVIVDIEKWWIGDMSSTQSNSTNTSNHYSYMGSKICIQSDRWT